MGNTYSAGPGAASGGHSALSLTRYWRYFNILPSPLAGEGCAVLASGSEPRRSWVRGKRSHRDSTMAASTPSILSVTLLFQNRSTRKPSPSSHSVLAPSYMMRSEEHTSELQSLMRISYAVFCLKKKKITHTT